MPDARLLRTSREVFVSALAGAANDIETWVVDRMVALLEEEEVVAGRRIYAEGEHVEYIYLIGGGAVRVRLSSEGKAPWTYEGRWAIGSYEALAERPHGRTAVALTDLHLVKLRADAWVELLEDSFSLARAVLANAVRGVAALEQKNWASLPDPRGTLLVAPPPVGVVLSFVDRLALLTEVAILEHAGVQVLADLAELAEEQTFEAGEAVYTRGTASGRMHLVLEGEVRATRKGPDLSVLFGAGSIVCGVAAQGEPEADWNAHAVVRTRTLAIKLEDWFDLMEVHFDLLRAALVGIAAVRERHLEALADRAGGLVLP